MLGIVCRDGFDYNELISQNKQEAAKYLEEICKLVFALDEEKTKRELPELCSKLLNINPSSAVNDPQGYATGQRERPLLEV